MLTILTRDESFHVPLNVHFLRETLARKPEASRLRLQLIHDLLFVALLLSSYASRRRAERFDQIPFRVLCRAYAEHLVAAHAWDTEALNGHPGQSGARIEVTEVPYDTPSTVYERNGVRISSFPVIHILNGSVGYRLDYNGLSVVFSGDTRPSHTLVEASDGVDLLIHETFPTAPVFAKKAGVPVDFAEMVVKVLGNALLLRRKPIESNEG